MDPEGISKTVLMKFERRAMSGSMMDTYVKVVGSSERDCSLSAPKRQSQEGKLCSFNLELESRKAGEAGGEDLWTTAGKG